MNATERKDRFFRQLNVSEKTKIHYRNGLNGSLLKEITNKMCGKTNVFEITDIKSLWKIYSVVNIHPKNITQHRNISCALMHYIRFLNNGEKYGHRVDFKDK